MRRKFKFLVGVIAVIPLTVIGCASKNSEVLTTFCNLYMGMTRQQVRENMGAPNDSKSNVDVWWYKSDLRQLPAGSMFRDADWTASVEYIQNLSSSMWVVEDQFPGKLQLPCPDMRE